MEKVIKIVALRDSEADQRLAFWQSKTPEERLEAVEILRRRFYGTPERLERSVKIVRRKRG